VSGAATHKAGYRRATRDAANARSEAPSADMKITKPLIMKNSGTPRCPWRARVDNQAGGASCSQPPAWPRNR
jgi:hypothetical protein